ncbi:hypothetical protein DEMA109039_18050 [Deinococcus marmoris]
MRAGDAGRLSGTPDTGAENLQSYVPDHVTLREPLQFFILVNRCLNEVGSDARRCQHCILQGEELPHTQEFPHGGRA